MLKIVERTKIWLGASILLIVIGLAALAIRGLNLGVDFKGGTVVDIKIGSSFNVDDVRTIAAKYDPQSIVRVVQGTEVEITSQKLTDAQVPQLFSDVKAKYKLQDSDLLSTDRIGATVGSELKKNALISSLIAVVGIMLYVWWRFELKSGTAAILALVHDILITIGVYAVFQVPVNSPFIAAILTILGYSINDTIVVFDRIRENKKLGKFKDFKTLVNASITQTMARSINTVVTTLITITVLYLVGVSSIKEFAAPLIVGIISGCYSSIFIASPLWVMFKRNEKYA